MFTRPNHGWIGIDVGASSVKLAQMVREGGRLRLEDAAIVARGKRWQEADLSQAAALSSADEVAEALASVPHCAGRAAAALLPTAACEFNTADAVETGESNQVAAIAAQLATVGIDLGSRVFDYWPGLPPGHGARAKQGSINILSTSRTWSKTLTGDIVNAGLDCRTIDGLPLTIARAITETDDSRNETTAAIDWGYSGATFVLIDQGLPLYVRRLKSTAFSEVTTRVAEDLNLADEEASELLQSVNIAGRKTDDEVSRVVAELLEPVLALLVGEVERTLGYVQSAGQRLAPNRIYLLGGGATIGGIDACLTQRLRRPVVIWRLDAESEEIARGKSFSTCLLGPAVALSALRWSSAA
ncbi:MAG: pilus assembly protein PilM [Aeoliella sp.]